VVLPIAPVVVISELLYRGSSESAIHENLSLRNPPVPSSFFMPVSIINLRESACSTFISNTEVAPCSGVMKMFGLFLFVRFS
jgi:hypothetical protein